MEERRIWKRRTGSQAGRIALSSGEERPCTISDHSRVGARLDFADPADIPDQFTLIFEDGHRPLRCKVRWRRDQAMGVEFL